MCGVVGYVGKPQKTTWLLEKLRALEYRGYDSAGISGTGPSGSPRFRTVGDISALEAIVPKNLKLSTAILHTRWATHGAVKTLNAHPHTGPAGLWHVVHNGIFAGTDTLKQTHSLKPLGQTDTEVFACLLEKLDPKNIDEFIKVFDLVQGSYALLCQKARTKTLYAAARGCPLYVGASPSGDVLAASDPICFAGFAQNFYIMPSGTFACLKKGKITFFDAEARPINIQPTPMDKTLAVPKISPCTHFMLKEIFEQPEALSRLVGHYKQARPFDAFDNAFLAQFEKVVLLGCGTAFHACLLGEKFLEEIAGLPARAYVASEFLCTRTTINFSKTLFILVSQSGETRDTLLCHELIKAKGGEVVAVVNATHSTLSQGAHFVLPICAGPEIAVASTKAYTCQVATLYMLACHIKQILSGEEIAYFDHILATANKMLDFDALRLDALADEIKNQKVVIFLGKSFGYVSALEAALKLKEITYIPALALPSGELKHGFLALVENRTPVIVFGGGEEVLEKNTLSGQEASSRGAMVTLVSNMPANHGVSISSAPAALLPLLEAPAMQYLAYKTCILLKLSPDKPRCLAKSVTVE